MENSAFWLEINKSGYLSSLIMKDDPYKMNWVIDDTYLKQAGYSDDGRMFGQFDLTINGETFYSRDYAPAIQEREQEIQISYELGPVKVTLAYELEQDGDTLFWKISMENRSGDELQVSDFGVWASFAYVMFRDKDVLRNIHNSAAVFPSISTDYTKINAVRRDNCGGNLGMYQLQGKTLSVGTYCDYENLFFENVSPSLDGMLYHRLILAGGYPAGAGKSEGAGSAAGEPDTTGIAGASASQDWIYERAALALAPGQQLTWEYALCRNEEQEDFQNRGLEFGHAKISYTPLSIVNQTVRLTAELPKEKTVTEVCVCFKEQGAVQEINALFEEKYGQYQIAFKPRTMGEHKVVLRLSDGTEDFVVLNVMDRLNRVLEERVAYICDELYNGPEGSTPYAFEPVSNQGESLGKLNLVLKKNLLGKLDAEQVRKVEESAVNYVRPKWFCDGEFTKPVKLYGDFYRCMDFEYIGHLFFLLSEFDDEVLALNTAETYLNWAADVFNLRVNPDLHEEERGKEEAQMLGVYFLYFKELMKKLKEHGLTEQYETMQALWEQVIDRIDREASTMKAAITEHYYDNAGFGPTAGALGESGKLDSAEKYGQLLLANIGYSNDFRAQNPDRWWEALTYMIHSLWGGVTAAAAFKVFEALQKVEYLEASYRATAGILYCYDTHSTATRPLGKGMAASTYAVAGPHMNRPDLSRERFGQSTFFRDGGIFVRLFENDTQTPDWDMGEELTAYLDTFGRKTFIVEEEDTIRVLNGSFEENEEEYLITSYAPYSEEFYLLSECGMVLLEKEKGKRRIALAKER